MKQNKVHQTPKLEQSKNKNDLTSFSPMSTALAIASSISATCCREESTFTEQIQRKGDRVLMLSNLIVDDCNII